VDAPSPYGPLWEWLSLGTFYVSGGHFLNHLLILKLIAILAYLGCTWLIYQILRQFQPQWAIAGAVSFAWSPLALLEGVQNGHNDIVMTFFLLAAVWAMNERMSEPANQEVLPPLSIRHSFVCLFLALSILVKFVTILVVPFFLLAMTRGRRTRLARLAWMAGYGFTITAPVVLLLLPLWPGRHNWAVLQAGGQAGRSLLALLILSLKDTWGIDFAFDFSRNLLFLIYGLIYLYYLWDMFNSNQGPARLLASSFAILFWYVLLAAPVFHAWYLLWFLPLASLLLPHQRPLVAAAVFSITALFVIPYFETVRVWYPALLHNQWLGHFMGVPLLIVPPAAALLWPIRPSAKSEV
jgi:alpha-1,6-mannosyltransferase